MLGDWLEQLSWISHANTYTRMLSLMPCSRKKKKRKLKRDEVKKREWSWDLIYGSYRNFPFYWNIYCFPIHIWQSKCSFLSYSEQDNRTLPIHRCREPQPFCFSPQQHPLLAYEALRWKEVVREALKNSLNKSHKHELVWSNIRFLLLLEKYRKHWHSSHRALQDK